MDLNLSGKRALVCGSSQGIGKATAIELATLGASVTLFSRNESKLNDVLAQLPTSEDQQHHVLVADFSDPAQVKHTVERHVEKLGAIEILVNNTGGPAPGPAHMAEASAFVDAFNLHLVSNQHLVQTLMAGMKEVGYGRIINIISTSVKQPIVGLGVSNTIRGAVASWAKSLANELGPFGITVNNVLPGATDTVRLDAIINNKASKQNKSQEQVIEEEKAIIPARRFAMAEELANAVAFLASPSAGYINGINLPVDGGRTSCL